MFYPKNGYGWKWGIFYQEIRIWMDMDLAGWGGVEWVSKFCPVKGSSPMGEPSHIHYMPPRHIFNINPRPAGPLYFPPSAEIGDS